MQHIIEDTEKWIKSPAAEPFLLPPAVPSPESPGEIFGSAVVEASLNLDPACILVLSPDGSLALDIWKYRPGVPIVCAVASPKAGRMLQVYGGVHPIVLDYKASGVNGTSGQLEAAKALARALHFCRAGDNVLAVTAGQESAATGDNSLPPNLGMHIHRIA